ncbi:MAG: penicillin-binding protein 2 [Anaerolineales bacterium]|nr:penicillin-binding protein 2 [Anaerolineales bacterium]
MRKEYAWRSVVLAALFGLIGVSIIVQMLRIQNSPEAETFRETALGFKGWMQTIYPARGEIYDRNGHLLAGNQIVYEVGITLSEVEKAENAATIAEALSTVLDVDYNNLYKAITQPDEGQIYYMVDEFVYAAQAETLMDMQAKMKENAIDGVEGQASLAGLEFREHLARSYPEGTVGANVLGFVTQAGYGIFGIEEKYNDLLAGSPVRIWIPADPNRVEEIPQVPDGTTLVLTIDRDLQVATENILDQAIYDYGAQSGTIIVMNPRNGEIMAMASTPRLNLSTFWNYENVFSNSSEFNRATNLPYEPGSVFKILTMAAALDAGVVEPDTTYIDTGAIQVGGAIIENWDKQAWGLQDMTGCLQHSLNVCLAWIAVEIGPNTFYRYMSDFGIGHATGIDLGGEAEGRLRIPGDADWYPVDLATNSFGQGVSTTPIQLMMATSAIANGGTMVTPHVLYGMVRNGEQYNIPVQNAGTPISRKTANELNEMLANSLAYGESEALVDGYRVAGKSGTAQIPTEYGWYATDVTNTSFIGWGPVDDPRFMIYVWLEKPSASIWASQTAAPVFSQVAETSALLLDIPPDQIRLQLTKK